MSMDALEIIIAGAILILFSVFMLWLHNDYKAERKQEQRREEQSRTIYLEVLQEMYRVGKKTDTPREQLELLTLRDQWVNISNLSLQEKTIAIRAGLTPANSRKIIKQTGIEALAAQAYLRCNKLLTVS